MGGGGGSDSDLFGKNPISNPFKDWQKDGKWDWRAIANDVVQPIRLGLWYDFKEGKIKDASLNRVKAVTGRSQAEKENRKKQNAINDERAARQREADLLWLDNYRRDMAGSSAAAGIRASAEARSQVVGSGGNAANEKLGSTSEDLLGV